MNFVLLTWALCGGLFIYAFLANFRDMLLKPKYGIPVDSAQDILDRGMIPFVWDGGAYYRDHLLQSPSSAYQKLGEIVVIANDWQHEEKMMMEDVHVANTHVYLSGNM